MIRWLHISDLHLGSEGTATAMLRDELPAFLVKKRLQCNYVFCTGDIRTANAKPNDFTDEMATFLKELCAAVGTKIERLFIVPGNHDVNRIVDGRADAIENALWGDKCYYYSEEGVIKPEDMVHIMVGENEFKAFLGKFYSPERLNYYCNPHAPHFSIETEDFNILHLDTTLAYTEGHEKDDLIVGTKALYDIIRALNRRKPTILLAHFPYACMRQAERKQLSAVLQHNGIRLWLAGHEHDQLLKREQYLYVLQSGELRKERNTNPSFLVGEYDPMTHDCKVSAFMWYTEGWASYPYVDLDNTPKDVFSFKLLPAEQEDCRESPFLLSKDEQKIAETVATFAGGIGELVNNPVIKNANIVLGDSQFLPPIALSSHMIERKSLVERCVAELNTGKLLVLYGALKIGKTELAKQVETAAPGIAVYDNTPFEQLEEIIGTLLREKRNGRAIIVTNSSLSLNLAGFDATVVCQIEVPLLTLEETKELIYTYNPTHDLCAFIWSHSNGHPVLVKTLCDYLSSCNWTINESNFSDILCFSFDHNLTRSISSLIGRIVPDKQDRAFLNRLLLVKGPFTEEDACKLASIEPPIDEPRMRLSALIPSWIMPVGGFLKANPLFDKAWKPDIPQEQYISCHRMLAYNILHKKRKLNEQDVLSYINHCMNAGDYDQAGEMYITVMLKIQECDGLPERSLFRKMWIDIPIQSEMSLQIRIGIRIIQLILFPKLKNRQRRYLLNDLVSLVNRCTDKESLPFYNSVIAMFSFLEGDTQLGLEHYKQYIDNKKEGSALLELEENAIPIFDNNIWFFLLRAETIEDFTRWINSFDAEKVHYAHDDIHVCESCYYSINHFIDFHLKEEAIALRINYLQDIQKLAESKDCPELAILCVFKQMELLARDMRFSEAREVYITHYHKFEAYPLAQILLNGSMANAHYRDKSVANQEAIPFFKKVLSVKNEELIPEIRSHMQQLYAYVIAEEDEAAGVSMLEEALKYVDNDKHRVDPYEYYQCAGELSYAYWCADNRQKAVETLSHCVSFVLNDLKGGASMYGKSYLCICDCLIMQYLCDLDNQQLPADLMAPFKGMFSESGLKEYDNLFEEDRLYTSSYQMCTLCVKLGLNELATEWAYKTVSVCKDRKEVREIHYLIFLLLPLFIIENDIETIKFVIAHSCQARSLPVQNYPELKRGNTDYLFVEFQIVPVLMSALTLKLRGDDAGINLIKHVLEEYTPLSDPELLGYVKQIINRSEYDKSFISEINCLDKNQYYAAYVCAYILTAFYSDSYYAYTLLISVLPSLEKKIIPILGKSAKYIINRFVADFWKAKILRASEEFTDYKHLCEKGLPLIEQYEGKDNQANHTMYVVQYHLRGDLSLSSEQEIWLEE